MYRYCSTVESIGTAIFSLKRNLLIPPTNSFEKGSRQKIYVLKGIQAQSHQKYQRKKNDKSNGLDYPIITENMGWKYLWRFVQECIQCVARSETNHTNTKISCTIYKGT